MAYVDFLTRVHRSTSRNYLERVTQYDKAECAEVAIRFGQDYWDGDRKYGYGGYRDDGRWKPIAEEMVRHYRLAPGARILDVGCGKAFLLHELGRACPGAQVSGIDLSRYALENAKPEVRPRLAGARAESLPFADHSFDFVFSLNVLHNLYNFRLHHALQEIERVSRGPKYIVVETYTSERQKVNMIYWQLTCRAFHTPQEWEWIFRQAGYGGDHSFITFD